MSVDAEIDELLSDHETHPETSIIAMCKWDRCPDTFDDPSKLALHLRIDHIDKDKDLVCKWTGCGRAGQKQNTRHALITHCRAHTGDRPYVCMQPGCYKTFTRSDALNKHLRTLHGPGAEAAQADTSSSSSSKLRAIAPSPASSDKPPQPDTPRHARVATKSRRKKAETPPSPAVDPSRAETELSHDEELSAPLARLRERQPVWDLTSSETEAMAIVREAHYRPPPSSDDGFDQGIGVGVPDLPSVIGEITDPDDPDKMCQVYDRSKWEVKYIMAKAKLMLLMEENDMRRTEYEQLLQRDEELSQTFDDA